MLVEFCISDLVAGISRGLPDRLAIVTPETRTTWRELDDRVTRLAAGLVSTGLACRGDTSDTSTLDARIGSVQDHVGLLCGNCPEYIETMAACFRARLVPVNVNYRYTAPELAYVIGDADLRAVVYQTRFGPELASAIEMAGGAPALFHVDDTSAVPPLAGSVALAELTGAGAPAGPLPAASGDDRYILYTGGTTGWPKGAVWRQEDWYFAALGGALRGFGTPEEAVARAVSSRTLPGIASSPFMHGGGHWAAFVILLQGGTLVLPPSPDRLDPVAIWSTVEAERVVFLQLIGDAFLGPLVDELVRGDYDVSSLRFVTSSGAIASPTRKAALLEQIPRLRILDTVGSSESGATAVNESTSDRPPDSEGAQRFVLEPAADVLTLGTPHRPAAPGEVGWLAQSGHVPLGYYKDAAKTAATFPVVNGVRHSIPGDQAVRTPDGEVLLLGRGSLCINTGGEKVYPEEVEQVLKSHPDVEDALVAGFVHARWGQAVGAVVSSRDGRDLEPGVLESHLRGRLAGYKIPKRWVLSPAIRRNQMGKPDYAWAREQLTD